MKNKIQEHSHQIELLKKYFPVDEENKIVTIKIYYEKATDMLDFSVGENGQEMLNRDVLEKISELSNKIPLEYKIKAIFVVDDYCGYKPSDLLDKFNDCIELNNYEIVLERKKRWIIAAILILVGLATLLILGLARSFNWIQDGLNKEIIEETLDIAGTIFIWEALTQMFLTPSELGEIGPRLVFRLKEITMFDGNENEVGHELQEEIMKNWEIESKISNMKKSSLLIVSTLLLSLGIYNFLLNGIDFFSIILPSINQGTIDNSRIALVYIFSVLTLCLNTLTIGAGITGILTYKGNTKAKRFIKLFSIIISINVIVSLVLSIILGYNSEIISKSILLVVELIYIYFGFTISKKK